MESWFRFLLGYALPIAWYYGAFLYLTNYYQHDPRERSGLAASAIMVSWLYIFTKLWFCNNPICDDYYLSLYMQALLCSIVVLIVVFLTCIWIYWRCTKHDMYVYMSCYRLWKKGSKQCINMCESTSSIKDELLLCGAHTMCGMILSVKTPQLYRIMLQKGFLSLNLKRCIDSCQNICKIIWKWILLCSWKTDAKSLLMNKVYFQLICSLWSTK